MWTQQQMGAGVKSLGTSLASACVKALPFGQQGMNLLSNYMRPAPQEAFTQLATAIDRSRASMRVSAPKEEQKGEYAFKVVEKLQRIRSQIPDRSRTLQTRMHQVKEK